ncbi:hypothetical protein ACPVPU_14055 [Sphingomonas sp. CJ99]
MAIRGFRGLGWLGGAVVVALGCNMVSSHVDAERQRVVALDNAIAATEADIRMLEAEFMTRANTAQLERWNGELMRLSVPAAGQFMTGEAALAQLEQPGEAGDRQFAGYIVPEAVPALAAKPLEAADVPQVAKPAPQVAAATTAAVGPAPTPQPIAPAQTVKVKSVVTPAAAPRAGKGAGRAAPLEDKLLRDTSFSDLLRGSAAGGATLR